MVRSYKAINPNTSEKECSASRVGNVLVLPMLLIVFLCQVILRDDVKKQFPILETKNSLFNP